MVYGTVVMAYSSHGILPYAMTTKKNGDYMKSAQIIHLKCRLVKTLHGPYQTLWNASISNGTVNFAGEHS